MDERIPTLEEALNAIIDRGLGLNLEIKPCPGREKETAEVALDFATRIWPDDTPPPLISSFSHVSLESAMDMMEEWPRGFLFDEHFNEWRAVAEHLDAHTININGNKITRAQLDEYLEYAKPVLAYTINDPRKAQELFDWGVAGVFSDCPDVIREAIESVH
jgi:glycerophosphoryl diester phosphodiesterase